MKTYKIFFIICLCALLLSCANASPKAPHGLKTMLPKNSDAAEFLNFSSQYSSSLLEVQQQELIITNQNLALNPSDIVQRMKLIMIYALPNSQLQDIQKAQNLLTNLLQENNLTNTQLSFAHLLFDQLLASNRLNLKIKDEQKRIETLQQNNVNLQLKLDAAQKKIKEISNIEKLMGERELSPQK